MLYDARPERVLRKGYQVKYVSVKQPGHDVKYVPVYRSPSGDEVFEDEATVDGIAIVQMFSAVPSKWERERAVAKLAQILRACGKIPSPNVDSFQLKQAIIAMALEPELKLQIGQQEVQSLPSESPDAEFAVSLLADSGLKEAIAPLTKLLVYSSSWDHHTDEDSVHELARTTLRRFLADNSEFRYVAAREALALLGQQHVDYYRDTVKIWAVELLVGLTYPTSVHRDWAREQLKELVGTQVV